MSDKSEELMLDQLLKLAESVVALQKVVKGLNRKLDNDHASSREQILALRERVEILEGKTPSKFGQGTIEYNERVEKLLGIKYANVIQFLEGFERVHGMKADELDIEYYNANNQFGVKI